MQEQSGMQKKRFQGWIMIILATCCISFIGNFWSNGTTVANAMMMKDPNNTVSYLVFGFGFTLVSIVMAIGAQVGGFLNDKFGPRTLFKIGAILGIGSGLILSNFINGDFMYLLTYSVGGALAYTFSGYTTTQYIANQWFIKRRGMANSIINVGTVFAGIVTPPLVTWLIIQNGGNWHIGHYYYGITAILGLILAFFIINKPSDVGQFPDGVDPALAAQDTPAGEKVKKVFKPKIFINTDLAKHYSYKDALKTPMFWATIVMFVAVNLAGSFMMNPGAVLFTSTGWDMTVISGVLSLRQVFRFAFLLLCMWFLDRFEPIRVMTFVTIFTAVSYVLAADATQYWQVLLFYLAGSVIISAALTVPAVFVANYFGTTNFAKIMGAIILFGSGLGGLSSAISGYIKTVTGAYTAGYYIWAAVCLVSFFVCLWIWIHTEKKKKEQNNQQPLSA